MQYKALSLGLIKNHLTNVVKYKIGDEDLLPYFATLYLTLRCNYACTFCDDGSAKHKYPDLEMDELSTGKFKKLLKILKKSAPSIYFTGGEPYLRKDLLELCKFSKKIGFKPVSVNTNGLLIGSYPEIMDNVDQLVISLFTLDPKKYAKTIQKPEKCLEIVKKNIDLARKKKNLMLTINCVVTKDSLEDAEEVMDFCIKKNVNFAIVPAMVGCYPDKDLFHNKKYQNLINKVISKKKQGKLIFNSYKSLEVMKNFKKFTCLPLLTPHLYPNGDLFYPCQLLKTKVNLLEIGDYKKAIKEGRKKFGSVPKCDNRCHLSCYIEPGAMTINPLNLLKL